MTGTILAYIYSMKELKWENKILVAEDINDISDQVHRDLCASAKIAMSRAYAIYSDYQVGAAVLMSNGIIIQGANQENAVYPLGLCAERVAIFAACTQYPDEKIMAIAVATEKKMRHGEMPAFPCGSCRQVIVEQEYRFKLSIPIYIINSDVKIYLAASVKDILPFAFNQNFL